MPGKKCPKCNQLTFFMSGRKGECKNCGYKMHVPTNEGRGGKGKKCLNCGCFTVFDGVCNNCGAKYR